MRYIGGLYVWQFQQLFDDVGMMAPIVQLSLMESIL